MLAGKGDRLPVSAFPVDGTWPTRHGAVGEAQHRDRDSRSGTRSSASSATSARWSARTRRSAPRSTTKRRSAARRRRSSTCPTRAASSPAKYTIQVAPEDCTGCSLCVMVCPAKDKANPKHKAIDMAPQPPLREAERENYAFFLDPAGGRPHARRRSTSRRRSSCSRSSSTRAPAPAAARRRTSSCSRSSSATARSSRTRPAARRSTAATCRRRRTRPTRRPRPGLVELAVRGQRRVRPRHAPGASTSTCAKAQALLGSVNGARAGGARRRRCSTPIRRPKPGSTAQRERVVELRRICGLGSPTTAEATPPSWRTWPTTS